MNWLGKWLTGSNFFQCYNNGGADRVTSIVAKFACFFFSLELNISRTRKARGCPRKNVLSVSLNNSRNIHSKVIPQKLRQTLIYWMNRNSNWTIVIRSGRLWKRESNFQCLQAYLRTLPHFTILFDVKPIQMFFFVYRKLRDENTS